MRFLVAALALVALCTSPAAASIVDDIVAEASLAEFQSYIRVLTGVDPVPGGPPTYLTNRYSFGSDIYVAGQWIYDHFASLGLDASYHTYDAAYGPTVVGELRGTTRPDDIYVICGHYDTYNAANQLNAPGCDDNASGTATVMMAARIFSQYEFEGTLRFIAFSGEEQGMVGSTRYAAQAWGAHENIVALINYDMFLHPSFDNAEPDPDYDLDIAHVRHTEWLADLMVEQLARYTTIEAETHLDAKSYSDQKPFWDRFFGAIGVSENTVDEIWGRSNFAYHSPSDTIDNPDYDWPFALAAVRGGYATIASLAVPVPEPGTLALFATFALVLAIARRRR
jgi:Zn-dependent M28 family amino/carboxypeptidase